VFTDGDVSIAAAVRVNDSETAVVQIY